MKLACLWNDENERSIIEHEIRSAEPTWELVFFPWKQVSAMGPLLDILRSDYSAILLHLSLPPCAALTLSELRHRDKLSTQIVLTSRTPADPDALSTLFSGRIHPESDVYRVASKISSIVDTPPKILVRRRTRTRNSVRNQLGRFSKSAVHGDLPRKAVTQD